MDTFKVASHNPFVPKSTKVYQAEFAMGPNTDDAFMPAFEFSVSDPLAELYVQLGCYDAEDDLFATVVSIDGQDSERVARTNLGKYVNSLGPVTLTKGQYKLIIHPDLESDDQTERRRELFRFGLDVLLEKAEFGGPA